MRWCPRARTAAIALGIASVLAGCRGNRPATSTDVVMQFYTMRDAAGITRMPTAKELAALRPFIADTLARALADADSMRTADETRVPDAQPSFADGDPFSSLFGGSTSYRVMPALDSIAPVRVPVEFTNDSQRPAEHWTDRAVVVQQAGRWVMRDIRYGGTWDVANKGSLLSQLHVTTPP